jgi:hypothetical protein
MKPTKISAVDVWRRIVNYSTAIVGIFMIFSGCVIMYLATPGEWWADYPSVQAVIREVGALLIPTVVIALFWELYGKRAFLGEVLAKTGLAWDLTSSGIVRCFSSFQQLSDWSQFFDTTGKIELFFAYGRTWHSTHLDELRGFVARKGTELHIVLPDPNSSRVVADLAYRFDMKEDQVSGLIREAAKNFENLKGFAHSSSKVTVEFTRVTPLFTFYIFDNIAVIAFHSHGRERQGVPTFVVSKSGSMYGFVKREIADLQRGNGG